MELIVLNYSVIANVASKCVTECLSAAILSPCQSLSYLRATQLITSAGGDLTLARCQEVSVSHAYC